MTSGNAKWFSVVRAVGILHLHFKRFAQCPEEVTEARFKPHHYEPKM